MICDPWLEGTVFNDGWLHITETKYDYSNFSSITHIWISHEHPDHFSPSSLKKIPESVRNQIVLLYHVTADRKIVDYCAKLGFKDIVEIAESEVYKLTGDVNLINNMVDHDSYLLIRNEEISILNLNDCMLKTRQDVEDVKSAIGPIDVLLTQFSYAQWAGNLDEREARLDAGKRKLEQLKIQIEILAPSYVIPFASFVRFCHEENNYLNDSVNRVTAVSNFIADECGAKPIVMCLGDKWIMGSDYDSTASIAEWERLYDLMINNEVDLIKTKPVSEQDLTSTANAFLAKAKKHFKKMDLIRIKPLVAYVKDLNKSFEINLLKGFREVQIAPPDAHIRITADSLRFCFKIDQGFNTTHVNARIELNSENGGRELYFTYEELANMINHHVKFPSFFKRLLNRFS